jgi:hypothetical protein
MNRALSLTAALSVFGLLALAACAGETSDDPNDDEALGGDEQEIRKSEGKKCGGFAGITCPSGSNCKLKGNFPDAPGTCQKPKAGEVGALCGGTGSLQCKTGLVCKIASSSGGPPPGAVGLPAPGSGGPPPGAVGLPAPRKGTCQESASKPRPGEEGGICGGIAGFACDPGLTCKMSGPSHPDQAGKCIKSSGPPPGAVGLPKPNN